MSPEDVLAFIEFEVVKTPAEKMALAQLSMTAQLLIELRAMRREIMDAIPGEPLQVEVCNTVYTAGAP